MEIIKYTHKQTVDYSIKLTISEKDNIAMSTFSFSDGGVEVSLVGMTGNQIAELVYRLEEIYQQIVMQEELNLDKLQSGIMEAKQVQAEVDNEVHN